MDEIWDYVSDLNSMENVRTLPSKEMTQLLHEVNSMLKANP